jgi:hypothetical protein
MSSTRTDRWAAALAFSYPTPQHAFLLRADLAWAEAQLSSGYYDDIPGKVDEVRSYLVEAKAHLTHLMRLGRRAA